MIRMVHFATLRSLLPLVQAYGVDPDVWWTWQRAPAWLHKMWEIARRERQRHRTARKAEPFQYWRHPSLTLPRCIDVTKPGLAERIERHRQFRDARIRKALTKLSDRA